MTFENRRFDIKSTRQLVDSVSLRQAKVLREMLKLGSFTSSEIAVATGESDRYIQNMISDADGVLKRLRLLVAVSKVKESRVGAPTKVWAVDPEKQDEVLKCLTPHMEDFETERQASPVAVSERGISEKFVYRFYRRDPDSPDSSDANSFGTTISIQTDGESVSFCAPEMHPISEISGAHDAIFVDSTKIANGLAAICQIRPNSSQGVTAIVNFRVGEANFVFLRKGVPTLFSSAQLLEDRRFASKSKISDLGVENQQLVLAQLQAAMQLYRTSNANEAINEILITGNLRAPSEVCKLISRVLHVPCTFLDPTESFAFSPKCVNPSKSRSLIMNYVPEIGYAFKMWQFDQQSDPLGSWSQNRERTSPPRDSLFKTH